jgi:hypothetical protein
MLMINLWQLLYCTYIIDMAESKNKREFFFQCQYQVGKEVLASTIVNDAENISVAKMMEALFRLALKVKADVDLKSGERVALEVVHIIKDLINNVDYEPKAMLVRILIIWIGTPNIRVIGLSVST